MTLETAQVTQKLIETQMMLLQYQHKEISATIETLTKAANDIPTVS